MKSLMPFLVTGVATGSIFALAALGLVLTYKTSGVFNFAHGAVGTVAAYVVYELRERHGWPWPLAVAVSLILVGVGGGVLLERLARRLSEVGVELKVLATVGILVAVQALAIARYGSAALPVRSFLSQNTFRFGGVNVTYEQLTVSLLGLAAAVGLSLFMRRTRSGIAMRGVVDNPALLALSATSPSKVRTRSWIIGSTFASVSGILLAPFLGLDPILLTLLVVQAFGAAAVGYFSNLPLTYVGGLAIGIGQALLTKWASTRPSLSGLPPAFPFMVLFFALLVLPKRLLIEAGQRVKSARASSARAGRRLPVQARLIGYAAVAGLFLAAPAFVGTKLQFWTDAVIFVVIFASLQLLVRTSGQVSVAHAAFVAVGAATFAQVANDGKPWLVALLVGGLVTVPVGAIVAIPAIRLRGVYLAVATFGFGLLLQQVFYTKSFMFGGYGQLSAPRPEFLGIDFTTDKGFHYVAVMVAVAALLLKLVIQRSRLGRLLRAMAGSPVALETYGASVNLTRVLVFCISAFFAGIAGGLFAAKAQAINGDPFTAFHSLMWLAVLMVAGSAPVASTVIAAVLLVLVPGYIDNPTVLDYQPVFFGAAAVAVAAVAGGAGAVARERVARRFEQMKAATAGRTSRSPVSARRAASEVALHRS
ncbi:MAG TPA: ABC transporter permease [Acidimicrobiia bacterium]|nr:ABC transporter permease [Acidimicrobiia bacterium]